MPAVPSFSIMHLDDVDPATLLEVELFVWWVKPSPLDRRQLAHRATFLLATLQLISRARMMCVGVVVPTPTPHGTTRRRATWVTDAPSPNNATTRRRSGRERGPASADRAWDLAFARGHREPGSRFRNYCGTPVQPLAAARTRFASPEAYTPKHLAEKILTSRSALEGERKYVTVLFADLKGSMELLRGRPLLGATRQTVPAAGPGHGGPCAASGGAVPACLCLQRDDLLTRPAAFG
jgi:hypothetical protein